MVQIAKEKDIPKIGDLLGQVCLVHHNGRPDIFNVGRKHYDEEYAKNAPFGKLIAPGVMSFMSVWAKYFEVDFFGEELLAGKSTKSNG